MLVNHEVHKVGSPLDLWTTVIAYGAYYDPNLAFTSELRLPLLTRVTISSSARYDQYRIPGGPLASLLLRSRYGTAFKAPTLSDEF